MLRCHYADAATPMPRYCLLPPRSAAADADAASDGITLDMRYTICHAARLDAMIFLRVDAASASRASHDARTRCRCCCHHDDVYAMPPRCHAYALLIHCFSIRASTTPCRHAPLRHRLPHRPPRRLYFAYHAFFAIRHDMPAAAMMLPYDYYAAAARLLICLRYGMLRRRRHYCCLCAMLLALRWLCC